MFYSKEARGFYDLELHGDSIPLDAVSISADEHAALLAAQARGQIITTNPSGYPVAVDPPPPTQTESWMRLRAERDRRLAVSDNSVLPDLWETYNTARRAAWAAYRQALRDLPAATTDPANPIWPTEPGAATDDLTA